MRCLGQFIGCLLVITVMAIAPAVIWFFVFWNVGLDANTYTGALDDDTYEEMATMVLPAFAQVVRHSGEQGLNGEQAGTLSEIIIHFEYDEWEEVAGDWIDPEWVRTTIESNINQATDYLRYENDRLDFEINFTPIARVLEEEDVVGSIMSIIEGMPACNDVQDREMANFLEGDFASFPDCDPGATSREAIASLLFDNARAILEHPEDTPSNVQVLLELTDLSTDELEAEDNIADVSNEVLRFVQRQDRCTESEENELHAFLSGEGDTFPNCDPGYSGRDTIRTVLLGGIEAMQNQLEDIRRPGAPSDSTYVLNLRDEAAKEAGTASVPDYEEADRVINETRQAFYFVDNTIVVILLFPVMLLSLVMIFAVRSSKQFFFWMGIPLLGTAIFTLLPLLPWIYGMLYGPGADIGVNNSPDYALGLRFQRLMFSAFSAPILVAVLITLVAGFIFILLAGLLKEPGKKQQQVFYVMPGTQSSGFPQGQFVQPPVPPQPPTPAAPPRVPRAPGPPPKPKPPSPPPSPAARLSSDIEIITPTPVDYEVPNDQTFIPDSHATNIDHQPPPERKSSAVERFKDELDSPDVPDGQTFIPPADDDKEN